MSVGTNVLRKDGAAKVSGAAIYVDDLAPEGCWHGATVRSTIPHGRIREIHFPEGLPWAEVVVVTAADIPGRNLVALIYEDQPLLADGLVRHVGEPILLIAAPTRAQARLLASRVEIEYEPLPAVVDLNQALEQGPADDCQSCKPLHIQRGDLEQGFARADHIVEGTYFVGHQEQLYIEPNGFIAWWEDGGRLVVKGSHQCPYYVHKALREAFGLEDDQLRVVCTTTGGGFGGKEDFPSVIAGHAALLARKAGRPVKLVYARGEDFTCTTKRHPARIYYRVGVAKDGTFRACYAELDIDVGAYITLSPVVLSRGSIHITGPYAFPAVDVHGRGLATHTPPNGAFRGFGAPQAYFGLERHVDRIAHTLGLDPAEVRRKNLLEPGGLTGTGQRLEDSVSAAQVLAAALARSGWAEERLRAASESKPPATLAAGAGRRRGMGLALYMHGTGFTGSGESRMKTLVGLRLHPDGTVEILTSSTDIGQGTATVFPQIVSAAMGIDYSRIFMAVPDTSRVPDSGPTVASRTVTIVGKVVQSAALELKTRMLEAAARYYGGQAAEYRLEGQTLVRQWSGEPVSGLDMLASQMIGELGVVSVQQGYQLNPRLKWDEERYSGDAYPAYSWGCTVIAVAVDPDTLEVAVERVVTVHDIGTVIHPVLAAGQVEGGLAQAIGYGLMEEVHWRDGRMLNHTFTNYVIPTALDLPDLETTFVENPFSDGPFGAKGVGELPMNGAAPALANAIAHAIGADVFQAPVTPERILRALIEAGMAGGAP